MTPHSLGAEPGRDTVVGGGCSMNSIKNVPARVLSRRPGHSLEAEREQFDKTQASAGTGWAGGGGDGGGGGPRSARPCADGCGLRGPGRRR